MTPYELVLTRQFKKDAKQAQKRGKNIGKLELVINILIQGKLLPLKYKDHALIGNWKNHRECHIEPDWLLIYYIKDDTLNLFEQDLIQIFNFK